MATSRATAASPSANPNARPVRKAKRRLYSHKLEHLGFNREAYREVAEALRDRPIVSLSEIAVLTDTDIHTLRTICESEHYQPPVKFTPDGAGRPSYLVTPQWAYILIRRVLDYKQGRGIKWYKQGTNPNRGIRVIGREASHDRLTLWLWMLGLDKVKLSNNMPGGHWAPYQLTIEREIKRIAKLREPNRTLRAMDLLQRFVDARIIAHAMLNHRPLEQVEVVEEYLAKLIQEDEDKDKVRAEKRKVSLAKSMEEAKRRLNAGERINTGCNRDRVMSNLAYDRPM